MIRRFKKLLSENIALIGLLIVASIIISLTSWYSSVMEEEVVDANRREMHEILLQAELSFENIIDESIDDLKKLASYIAKENVTKENIVEYLNSQSQAEEFEDLFYIGLDGVGIGINGEEHDFSLNTVFLNALNSPLVISTPPFVSDVSKLFTDIAIPVIKDGKTTAILFTKISLNTFQKTISKLSRGTGLVFILDKSLRVLYTNSPAHIENPVISASDISEMGTEQTNNALRNIMEGKNGSFTYEIDGIKKIVIYSPIVMSEWILGISIEADSVNSSLRKSVNQINLTAGIILFVLFLLTTYIWFTRTNLLRSLEQTAYYDSLTGLPNLVKIKKDISLVLNNNKDSKYAILKFDIANFKVVNEFFGFEVGNRVLQATKTAYETITEPSLLVARIGADEFLIFAGNGFLDKIERRVSIYENYYRKLLPEIGNHKLSFNYGKYEIEAGETDVDVIVNNVTIAHKMAKKRKSERVFYYDKFIKMQILLEAEINDKMDVALHNNEFKAYLQPKFDIVEDKLIGAEALVRWISNSGKIVYPDTFIPIFEKTGFIKEVDRYILETVCKMIRSWLDEGLEVVPVSVNCSRVNLSNINLFEEINEVVDKYQIPHKYIDIELTESAMIGNEQCIEELFNKLHSADYKISIDDFGAGYSSLGLLKSLNADTLKLDKSFMGNSENTVRSAKVIGGVIRLAHSLNMTVVAEGVESIEQIEALKVVRCDAVQGYFYAKPMPISDFENLYKSQLQKK